MSYVVKLLTVIVVMTNATFAQAVPISSTEIVNNWSSVNLYGAGGPDLVDWTAVGDEVTNGPSSNVTNTIGGIVSDFETLGDFSFSSDFRMPNNDNVVSFVFGYQDNNNHYRLSWGGGTQQDVNFGGLSILRVLDAPPAPGAEDFTALVHDPSLLWGDFGILETGDTHPGHNELFSVDISRAGDFLNITIALGLTEIFSTSIFDDTFMTGQIGFGTIGQETFFSNVDLVGEISSPPEPPVSVPEPGTLGLLGVGLFGLIFMRRKQITVRDI